MSQRIRVRLDPHHAKASVDPDTGDIVIQVMCMNALHMVLSDTETFDSVDGSGIIACDDPDMEEEGVEGLTPIISFEVE